MNHLFISHSSRDGREAAHQLVGALEVAGHPCWIAPRNMKPALPFPEQIVDAISACRGFVLLLTPEANQSLDVLQELVQAHHERKLIAALTVQNTEPSKNLIYYLRVRQRIVWTQARDAAAALGQVFSEPRVTLPVHKAEGVLREGGAGSEAIEIEVVPAQTPPPTRTPVQGLKVAPPVRAQATSPAKFARVEAPAEQTPPMVSSRRVGESFRDFAEGPELVVIPPGTFLMGSPDGEPERASNEGPVHKVTIGYPLAVAKYPITRAEWRYFVQATKRQGNEWDRYSSQQKDTHPVINVSWQDAVDYAAWLSKKTNKKYRLLSEAEYEYANRAGKATAYWWGDSADELKNRANRGMGRFQFTSPVDSFPPNPFGLHDTTGNAWCWVQDVYHSNYKGAPTDGSAWEAGGSPSRVVRGSSWGNAGVGVDPSWFRSACRFNGDGLVARGNFVGFRVARTD